MHLLMVQHAGVFRDAGTELRIAREAITRAAEILSQLP
jgi:hypothetical protein